MKAKKSNYTLSWSTSNMTTESELIHTSRAPVAGSKKMKPDSA